MHPDDWNQVETHWIAMYVNGNDIVHFDSLTRYAAVLNICNILLSTLLVSVVKLISLLWVFIAIFEFLSMCPHFLNYFFFIFITCDGEGHLSYSRRRKTKRYLPFLFWYCIKSWACMVFIFLIFLTRYMVHCICTVNFIQTLFYTKS